MTTQHTHRAAPRPAFRLSRDHADTPLAAPARVGRTLGGAAAQAERPRRCVGRSERGCLSTPRFVAEQGRATTDAAVARASTLRGRSGTCGARRTRGRRIAQGAPGRPRREARVGAPRRAGEARHLGAAAVEVDEHGPDVSVADPSRRVDDFGRDHLRPPLGPPLARDASEATRHARRHVAGREEDDERRAQRANRRRSEAPRTYRHAASMQSTCGAP
jgi:hypothetical protein